MSRTGRKEILNLSTRETTLESCRNYIQDRESSYAFRSIRYEAVLDTLLLLGLSDGDSIIDVGGADGDFGRYLKEQGIKVRYEVVDGMKDGTNLNNWVPTKTADFMVSIEVIEHLESPSDFLQTLDAHSIKGVVVTTPNPMVVNVFEMDKTHISEVFPRHFYAEGYNVYPAILFFEHGDSLIGLKDKRQQLGL